MVHILLYSLGRLFVNRGLALRINCALFAAALLLVSACAEKGDKDVAGQEAATPVLTADTLGQQTVLSVPEYLAQAPYASADPENGKRQAQVCRACHSLEAGGNHMIGPALSGFFGARAGARDGFEYSPVLRDANFIWTPRALDAWLAYPGRFLPGNRMTFAGVQKPADRDDLIAYLMRATSDSNETR